MVVNYLRAEYYPEKVWAESFAPQFPDHFPQFVKDIYFAILENMYWRLPQQHPDFDFKSLRTEIEYGKKWFRGDLSETENDVSAGDWWEAEINMIYILARCEHAATLENVECNRWILGEVWESVAKFSERLNSRPEVKDRIEFQKRYKVHIKNITCLQDLEKFPELNEYRVWPITKSERYSDEVVQKWMKKVAGNKLRGRGRPKGAMQKKVNSAGRGDDTGMFKGS